MRTLCWVGVTFFACGAPSGSGGTGGGSEKSEVVKFKLTNVTATYTASSSMALSPNDRQYMDGCSGAVTAARGKASVTELRPNQPVPSAIAASTDMTRDACNGRRVRSGMTETCTLMSDSATFDAFLMYLKPLGWSDTSNVELELVTLPMILGTCNSSGFGSPWDAKFLTTAPLSSFRGNDTFEVTFAGMNTMSGINEHHATFTYDLKVTLTPLP
ncbi:MAG: hypothetical protein JNK82_12930 [Myxococcaceae bacterium]|nr:hypothetical protein [Myxococcaceae bacterium]